MPSRNRNLRLLATYIQPANLMSTASCAPPMTTADLSIRARKPRSRTRGRRVLQGFGLFLVFLLFTYGILAARFHFSHPQITRNYARELEAAFRSESDCAYPAHRQFYIRLFTTGIYKSFPAGTHSFPDLMPGEVGWTEAVQFSLTCADDLPAVRAAARLPSLGGPCIDGDDPVYFEQTLKRNNSSRSIEPTSPNPMLFAMPLRHLSWCGHIASYVMLDARVALTEGDPSRYFQGLIATLNILHQLESEPSLMSSSVRLRDAAMVNQELRRLLTDTPDVLTDAQLVELSNAFSRFSSSSLKADLATEGIFIDDWIQRSFTDDGSGDGRFVAEGLPLLPNLAAGYYLAEPPRTFSFVEKAVHPLLPVFIAGRREFKDASELLITQTLAEAAVPRWKRPFMTSPSDFDMRVHRAIILSRLKKQYGLDEAFRHGIRNYENFAMDRDATLTAIALELHRRHTGHYPETLAELVPTLLPALPLDLWDGKPLKYRLEDNSPVLYTIGADLADNGGIRGTDESIRIGFPGHLSPQSMNKDWVFLPHYREPHAKESAALPSHESTSPTTPSRNTGGFPR